MSDHSFEESISHTHTMESLHKKSESEKMLYNESELEGFSDVLCKKLTMYIALCCQESNEENKLTLTTLYRWLITNKPTMNEVINSSFYSLIIECFSVYGMQEIDMSDVHQSLIDLEKEKMVLKDDKLFRR